MLLNFNIVIHVYFRLKMGNNQSESVLISQLENSVILEFEKTDADRKLRLLLSELLFVMSKVQ